MGKKKRIKAEIEAGVRGQPRHADSGLREMTKDQHEDFYHRWRDVMLACARHGAILVASTTHKAYFVDILERLIEDDWWKLANLTGEDPIMLFHEAMPVDEMKPWVEGRGLISMTELMGGKVGLGRFTKLGAPGVDQRPWGVDPGGVISDDERRQIVADSADMAERLEKQ